jgi:hypothetical protein
MIETTNNMSTMTTNRDSKGRFVKGHRGFKPKGAKSRKKKQPKNHLDIVLDFLLEEIIKTIPTLSPSERIRFYTKLLSFIVPKCKRISYEDYLRLKGESDDEKPHEVTFEVIVKQENSEPLVINV